MYHAKRTLTYLVPRIARFEQLRAANGAMPGLYSAAGLELVWFQRAQSLTEQLNASLLENRVENAPGELVQLLHVTRGKPALRRAGDAAAQLHNLQFCMESLAPGDGEVAKAPWEALLETPSIGVDVANAPRAAEGHGDGLREWLEFLFGLVAEFKTLLLNSAMGVQGDGVTWLVAKAEPALASNLAPYVHLAVVNTYNAGTVEVLRQNQVAKARQLRLVRAAAQQSETDPAEPAPSAEHADPLVLGSVQEAEHSVLYPERPLRPLLAVDASMAAYLHDYGVFGKARYLENVWRCIDWSVVERRMPARFKPPVSL